MSDLADATGGSRSRLSHAVARLAESGWVRREDCPTDRRGQIAVLTAHGFEVLSAAAPGHVDGVRRHLFDPLSPAQIDQLRRISEALVAHLEPDRPSS
jgi:DNA-binding MarR family transcriptional regulator